MERQIVSASELKKYHEALENDIVDAWVPGGFGSGEDKTISSKTLRQIHGEMRKHIDEYANTGHELHLARVHDAAENFVAENLFSCKTIEFVNFLKEKLAESQAVKKIGKK